MNDRVVITGVGMTTAVGLDRESSWWGMKNGRSGVRRLCGVPHLPDGLLLAATVDGVDADCRGDRNYPLGRLAAQEAVADSELDFDAIDPSRIGWSSGTCGGPTPTMIDDLVKLGQCEPTAPWWENLYLATPPARVARDLGLCGPRLCNSTACATGTIATVNALRAIRDGQCDMMVVGGAQTIHPILAAGFYNMRVLAQHDDPTAACRPFDANRTGFVMGEGAGALVLERLSSARARGARIYSEVLSGALLSDATHVTDLSTDSTTLVELLDVTLKRSRLVPGDVGYINAHGTGTKQNDAMETRGIRTAFGRAANDLCISTVKANIGHLINAAGVVELATTVLALRDGFAPPTVNLTTPDPECDLDCIPLVGRRRQIEHAVKISIAFGGHLAAVALRRWDGAESRCEPAPAAVQRLAA
jgi:3-oxoacyl-(acyl-carrier-protein) synthase